MLYSKTTREVGNSDGSRNKNVQKAEIVSVLAFVRSARMGPGGMVGVRLRNCMKLAFLCSTGKENWFASF